MFDLNVASNSQETHTVVQMANRSGDLVPQPFRLDTVWPPLDIAVLSLWNPKPPVSITQPPVPNRSRAPTTPHFKRFSKLALRPPNDKADPG